MSKSADIADAWCRLSKGQAVFVARKDGEFLCEGPYERLDLGTPGRAANDDTEACIRLFFLQAECDAYCAIWRELLNIGPENQRVRTMKAVLPDIWKHLAVIVSNSYADYQVPPRIDLCRLKHNEYPTLIDTLFSEREEMH